MKQQYFANSSHEKNFLNQGKTRPLLNACLFCQQEKNRTHPCRNDGKQNIFILAAHSIYFSRKIVMSGYDIWSQHKKHSGPCKSQNN